MKCPWCYRSIPNDRSFSVKRLQEKAIKWIIKNENIWKGKKVEQYNPMRVSDGWAYIAFGLKRAKIYKESYCDWDMSIDKLHKEAVNRIREIKK